MVGAAARVEARDRGHGDQLSAADVSVGGLAHEELWGNLLKAATRSKIILPAGALQSLSAMSVLLVTENLRVRHRISHGGVGNWPGAWPYFLRRAPSRR
jgi:hypothetical protein